MLNFRPIRGAGYGGDYAPLLDGTEPLDARVSDDGAALLLARFPAFALPGYSGPREGDGIDETLRTGLLLLGGTEEAPVERFFPLPDGATRADGEAEAARLLAAGALR